MDITLKWCLRPQKPYITPALIAHPIFSGKCKMECARKTGYAFFDKKLTEKLTFINTDFDFIMHNKNYRFWLTCVNLDNNAIIFSSSFSIKDCTINYDDSIITVVPEIEIPESKILKNWEKEYQVTKIGAAKGGGNLTIFPVYQFYMANDDTVYSVDHHFAFSSQSASSTDNAADLLKHLWQPAAIFLTLEWLNNQDNVGADFSGQLKRPNSGTMWSGTLTDIHNPNNYMNVYCEVRTDNDELRFWFPDVVIYKQTVHYNGVDYDFICKNKKYDCNDLNSEGVFNIADNAYNACFLAYGGMAWMRLVSAASAETDSDLEPLTVGDIIDNTCFASALNTNFFTPSNHPFEFVTSRNTTNVPTPYYSQILNAYFYAPRDCFAAIFQGVWGGCQSIWLKTSYFDLFGSYSKTIPMYDNYSLASIIQILAQNADGSITGFDFNPTINLLYISHITNYKKINYTVAATAGTITLKQILDFLQNVLKMFWFVENSTLKIYSYKNFVDTYFYQNRWNLKQLTNLQNDQKIDLGQNTVNYRSGDNPSVIEFEFPNTPIHENWADFKTISFDSILCADGEKQTVNIPYDTDIEGIIYNPTNFSDDGFVLLYIENNSFLYTYLTLRNIEAVFFAYDVADSFTLEDGTDITVLEKYKKHLCEQSVKINVKDFDFDLQKFTSVVSTAGVGFIETVKFAFYENPCSLEITAVL